MRIAVFGLGYVGCTTGACLAEMGNEVLGVEPNPLKVEMINGGRSPIVEKGLDELVGRMVREGRLFATTDWRRAVLQSDLAMISVGTPGNPNGSVNIHYVLNVCGQIGSGLKQRTGYFTIAVRSTVPPGTVEDRVIPILEKASGKRAGEDFGVCMNPEFLREGSSIDDFRNPPKTVIGQLDARSGDALETLYRNVGGPLLRVRIRVAEMIKYVDNSFHALKIAFGNEIGNLCKEMSIDSHQVMHLFCLDTKLNLSPCYLKPGFAFGGSCLPKDLRGLIHIARNFDLEVPVLSSILESNRRQIRRVTEKLLDYKGRRLGFLGLSFKGGTDDLRESPVVELVEFAIGKGFRLGIYDRDVSVARLMGANKEYIEHQIPHISTLLRNSAADLMADSDVIVVANRDDSFANALARDGNGKVIIDLVRLFEPGESFQGHYYGLCW